MDNPVPSRLDPLTRQMHPLPLRANGSLWSQQLNSWLVPAGNLLYLYDRQGRLRLTQAQAEAQRAEAEKRRADAEAEARQAEKRRADAEAKRAEALAEKLRSLGIDPNQL
jgi:hypothetical protein